MLSNQTIRNSIEKLKSITKADISVRGTDGSVAASTIAAEKVLPSAVRQFAQSPAQSQELQGAMLFKAFGQEETEYIVIIYGTGENRHMIGRIAAAQIEELIAVSKERYDRNDFIQNLLLDNLLLVDIYNRAKKLQIEAKVRRIVFIIEMRNEKDSTAMEVIRSLFGDEEGTIITEVDEKSTILIREVEEENTYEDMEGTARSIHDTMNTEAMVDVRVSCGTIVDEISQLSRSFKEAKMALNVGKIFYSGQRIHMYSTLGIGRLIYQLPENLCRMFIKEVFTKQMPDTFDEETVTTINCFFENSLNVSETARQLYVHRNTLVYRLEKLSKATGLDIRSFDDAVTFKIALMVENYLRYMEHHQV